MSPNTLAIRQHATVVQSVQSATPLRGWFAHIAQLLCRLPFKPLCKPCKPCNCTVCTTTTADPADPANCALCGRCGKGSGNTNHAMIAERSAMVAERHTVIHRQNYRHAGCAKCAFARLALCTLHKLEGSRGKPLELVKTLIVIFLIVNFPANGSQNPNEFALSKRLKFYVIKLHFR